jgi:hypothetical protein
LKRKTVPIILLKISSIFIISHFSIVRLPINFIQLPLFPKIHPPYPTARYQNPSPQTPPTGTEIPFETTNLPFPSHLQPHPAILTLEQHFIMVTKPGGPVPASAIPLRQFASLPLIALLYTSATPFTPFYWVLSIEGTYLLDRLFSGALLLSAVFFQYQISTQTYPVTITIPTSPPSSIRNGNVSTRSSNDEFVFLYKPSEYWYWVAGEVALLVVGEWAGHEYLRRAIAVGVVGVLWSIGWFCTPRWIKDTAWDI